MQINKIVDELEHIHDIEILYMRELGSRAHNLDSSKSDHDLRILFRQNPTDYIKMNSYTSNINHKFDSEWEVKGWDIKRFSELIYESNLTMVEFLNSPLIHYTKNVYFETIIQNLQDYISKNVNLVNLYYDYHSATSSMYNRFIKRWKINEEEIRNSSMGKYLDTMEHSPRIHINNGEKKLSFGRAGNYSIEKAQELNFVTETTFTRTVKKYLITLRNICCAKWIKIRKEIPPLDFIELMNNQDYLDKNVECNINNLIKKKKNGNDEEINDTLLNKFIELELSTNTLDYEKFNTKELNKQVINEFIDDVFNY